jgi:hypothetical protein
VRCNTAPSFESASGRCSVSRSSRRVFLCSAGLGHSLGMTHPYTTPGWNAFTHRASHGPPVPAPEGVRREEKILSNCNPLRLSIEGTLKRSHGPRSDRPEVLTFERAVPFRVPTPALSDFASAHKHQLTDTLFQANPRAWQGPRSLRVFTLDCPVCQSTTPVLPK